MMDFMSKNIDKKLVPIDCRNSRNQIECLILLEEDL